MTWCPRQDRLSDLFVGTIPGSAQIDLDGRDALLAVLVAAELLALYLEHRDELAIPLGIDFEGRDVLARNFLQRQDLGATRPAIGKGKLDLAVVKQGVADESDQCSASSNDTGSVCSSFVGEVMFAHFSLFRYERSAAIASEPCRTSSPSIVNGNQSIMAVASKHDHRLIASLCIDHVAEGVAVLLGLVVD